MTVSLPMPIAGTKDEITKYYPPPCETLSQYHSEAIAEESLLCNLLIL
jgi:hypothetical protein